MRETPHIASTAYASNQVNLMMPFQGAGIAAALGPRQSVWDDGREERELQMKQLLEHAKFQQAGAHNHNASIQPTPAEGKPTMPNASRRLVQVFIADPDENVPLTDCLLYSGDQKLTDLTDQELFFEVDIKSILDTHNAKRTGFVNKAVKERVEHLEPARIRDLKMTVVTIASF